MSNENSGTTTHLISTSATAAMWRRASELRAVLEGAGYNFGEPHGEGHDGELEVIFPAATPDGFQTEVVNWVRTGEGEMPNPENTQARELTGPATQPVETPRRVGNTWAVGAFEVDPPSGFFPA